MAPPVARVFYRDRLVETFWRQARIARDFYAASEHDGAFWTRRRNWPGAQAAHPPVSAPRLESQVLMRNGVLTRGEVLVTSADPGGAAFVMDQEIAPLIRAIGNRPLPALPDFYRKYLPQLPATTAEGLHGWLISRELGNSLVAQIQGTTRRFHHAKTNRLP